MHRILGAACYHTGRYHEAMNELAAAGSDRRDALYMQGLSAYHCGVYSQVPALLGEVTKERDALGQNAYLHMGLAYLQTGDHANARMAFEQAAASDADLGVKERAAYNHALCIHETSYSAFGESVTVFEKFLNRFPQSVYADRVSRYLVEVYMNTRSYDAALQSINRIGRPGAAILEAKQKILFQLGTQSFANADFPKALGFFEQSLQLGGQYNKQTQADACYWAGESEYRMNRYDRAEGFFINYLRNTPQRDTEMVPLAYYNLGYIAFHRQRYAQAEERFTACLRYRKALTPDVQADASNRLGDCCLRVRRFDEARAYYNRAPQLYPSVGDYSYYQLALVAGLQKDYNGKVQLLNQLAQKYPQSPYTVNALYEKGRSYVQTATPRKPSIPSTSWWSVIPKVRSAAKPWPRTACSIIRAMTSTVPLIPTSKSSPAIPAVRKHASPCATSRVSL